MSDSKHTDLPIDRLHYAILALRGVDDLLTLASAENDMHLVRPSNLAFLLGTILADLEEARDDLEPMVVGQR